MREPAGAPPVPWGGTENQVSITLSFHLRSYRALRAELRKQPRLLFGNHKAREIQIDMEEERAAVLTCIRTIRKARDKRLRAWRESQ